MLRFTGELVSNLSPQANSRQISGCKSAKVSQVGNLPQFKRFMFRKKFQFLHSNKHVGCGCATVRLRDALFSFLGYNPSSEPTCCSFSPGYQCTLVHKLAQLFYVQAPGLFFTFSRSNLPLSPLPLCPLCFTVTLLKKHVGFVSRVSFFSF